MQPLFAVVGDVDREPLGRADPPGFSGTVVETARLGLPALPAQGRGDASLAGLAAGSHTARVWYAGKQRARVAVSGSLSEADVIRNGRDLWTWESATNSAAHARLTEGEASEGKGGVATLPTTPEEAARQVLGAVTPTTAVRVGRAARVAGRPAYELVLAPKDARSLVDSVALAVDGQTKVPLRVRVFAKGQESPAFEVGFTEVQFRVPDPSVFRFTPPPGAKVTELGAGAEARARAGAAGPEELARRAGATRPAAGGPAVIGESWTSVVVARGVTAASVTGPARVLLDAAEPVQGAFGRGRLLRSPLVSALLTDNGRLYLGAVTPEALTAAAAQPASAARPLNGHVTAVGTAAQPASAARPLTGHVTAVGTAAQAPASPSARTGRPAPALVTRGLTKRFRGGQVAVDGLDLVVPAGSVFGFLGPNGSGKTTTIRMVLGLAAPTSGTAELLGAPVPGAAATVLHRVGALIEGPAFHPYLSGRANLERLDAADALADPGTTRLRVGQALERVGLTAAAGKRYRAYSLGMRQRLGLAAALLHPRELLVLDEPTNGLDPQGTREVRALVRELAAEGATVFLSSHLLSEVERVCTHVAVMRTGRLVAQGSLAELGAAAERRLRVETSEPDRAAGVLASLGCRAVERHVDGAGAVLDGVTPERACAALVAAGVPVRGLAVRRPSLEDTFVSLTGGGFDVDQ